MENDGKKATRKRRRASSRKRSQRAESKKRRRPMKAERYGPGNNMRTIYGLLEKNRGESREDEEITSTEEKGRRRRERRMGRADERVNATSSGTSGSASRGGGSRRLRCRGGEGRE